MCRSIGIGGILPPTLFALRLTAGQKLLKYEFESGLLINCFLSESPRRICNVLCPVSKLQWLLGCSLCSLFTAASKISIMVSGGRGRDRRQQQIVTLVSEQGPLRGQVMGIKRQILILNN